MSELQSYFHSLHLTPSLIADSPTLEIFAIHWYISSSLRIMGLTSTLTTALPRSVGEGIFALLAAFTLYSSILVVYRLFFHPLRKIPGPWLARATSWYEFYQDVVLVGHYVKEYPILHAKYG